jgi:signal peptidase I
MAGRELSPGWEQTRARIGAAVVALILPGGGWFQLERWRRGLGWTVAFFAAAALLTWTSKAYYLIAAVMIASAADVLIAAKPPFRKPSPALTAGIVAAVLIVGRVFVYGALVEPLKVGSDWMAPTLRFGNRVLVLRSAYGLEVPLSGERLGARPVQRGDLVAFRFHDESGRDRIGRVAAVGGDRIAVVDDRPVVNGVPAQPDAPGAELSFVDVKADSAAHWGQGTCRRAPESVGGATYDVCRDAVVDGVPVPGSLGDLRETAVPAGALFILHDNRVFSYDSRYFGAVQETDVRGRVVALP